MQLLRRVSQRHLGEFAAEKRWQKVVALLHSYQSAGLRAARCDPESGVSHPKPVVKRPSMLLTSTPSMLGRREQLADQAEMFCRGRAASDFARRTITDLDDVYFPSQLQT